MEFIVVVGLIVAAVFIYKKVTTPTTSDKLTLLQLDNWMLLYSKEGHFERSKMATALVVQAINLANAMGAGVPLNEVMADKAKDGTSSISVVDGWIDTIFKEMAKDVPAEYFAMTPARTACALLVLKMVRPSLYYQFLRDHA